MKLFYLLITIIYIIVLPFLKPVSAKSGFLPAQTEQKKQPILIVNFTVDKTTQKINVLSLRKSHGFIPDYKNPAMLDFVTVEVQLKTGLITVLLPLPPYEVPAPNIANKYFGGAKPKKLDNFTASVIIPYEANEKISIKKDFMNQNKKSEANSTIQIHNDDSVDAMVSQKIDNKEFSSKTISIPLSLTGPADAIVETVYDGNPALTNPADTYDIVFLSSEFTSDQIQDFRDFTVNQTDALFGIKDYPGKDPFSTNKSYFKIRRAFTTQDLSLANWEDLNLIVTNLGIPYDHISLVRNTDGRSFASSGGGYSTLFRFEGSNPLRTMAFTHEFAHAFGAIMDEYVEYTQESSDLGDYDRNCKVDPEAVWINNIQEGAYPGCNYHWNNYRPQPNSLMNDLTETYEFNEVTKSLFKDPLAAYTLNGFSLLVTPSKLINSIDPLHDSILPGRFIVLNNYGKNPVLYTTRVDTVPSWLNISLTSGTLNPGRYAQPTYINININKQMLTNPGKYSLNLFIDFSDGHSAPITKIIPIILYVGNRQEIPSISWVYPPTGSVIEQKSINNVTLNWNISDPGWKRIDYFYKTPYDLTSQYEYINYFNSRSISPFEASFITIPKPPDNIPYTPGTYELWAKGYPYVGSVNPETERIKIQLKAPPNTYCSRYNMPFEPHSCRPENDSPRCFLGTTDCQYLPYCCPNSMPFTPSPTPASPQFPGDATGEGAVSGLDYIIWMNHYLFPGKSNNNGDFNNSGVVNNLDYPIWQTNYNK